MTDEKNFLETRVDLLSLPGAKQLDGWLKRPENHLMRDGLTTGRSHADSQLFGVWAEESPVLQRMDACLHNLQYYGYLLSAMTPTHLPVSRTIGLAVKDARLCFDACELLDIQGRGIQITDLRSQEYQGATKNPQLKRQVPHKEALALTKSTLEFETAAGRFCDRLREVRDVASEAEQSVRQSIIDDRDESLLNAHRFAMNVLVPHIKQLCAQLSQDMGTLYAELGTGDRPVFCAGSITNQAAKAGPGNSNVVSIFGKGNQKE